MNTGGVNIIIVAAVLLALGGCATTPPGYSAGNPILSATDAKSMISIEVRELEPLPVEKAVVSN